MDNWCEGGNCQFHRFPYKAQIPVIIDGKREIRIFTSKQDVNEVIKLLIKETEDFNNQGKSFDVALSVSKQLPFFTCINIMYNVEAQKNISKYLYCKEFGMPPYSGSFGQQPKKWIDIMFTIKKAIAKKEQYMIDKQKGRGSNG